jgi:SsrA-binding protein
MTGALFFAIDMRIMAKEHNDSVICENRRARYNYELLDFYEGGLVLTGPEVKSLRGGGGQINEAYASFSRGELWLIGCHIAPYGNAGQAEQEERRTRKILLHEAELKRIQHGLERDGLTLVPLRLFWQKGRAKVALAVAKGKKTVDKRETIKKRDMERETRRIFKGRK